MTETRTIVHQTRQYEQGDVRLTLIQTLENSLVSMPELILTSLDGHAGDKQRLSLNYQQCVDLRQLLDLALDAARMGIS